LVRSGDRLDPVRVFEFVRANQAIYPIVTMCRLLGVSASGYHAWQRRPPSSRAQADAALLERIQQIHAVSQGTYGAPRIHAELAAMGTPVGRKRVARLMQSAGLAGVSRRRWPCTTRRAEKARPAPDLVDRDFSADGPDRLWVADITYIPTWSGFLYLAVVLDAFSRRVVGWAMANHLRTQLVLDALDMAIGQRRPNDVIHHSDQGSQLGLNRLSQHPAEGGCDGREAALGSIHAEGPSLAGPTAGGTTRAPADVLVGDRGGPYERRRRH
jgi:putative transposase